MLPVISECCAITNRDKQIPSALAAMVLASAARRANFMAALTTLFAGVASDERVSREQATEGKPREEID